MYFMKRSFVIPQFTTHVYQTKQKKKSLINHMFQRQRRTLLEKVFFQEYLYNVMRSFNVPSCFS